MKKSEGFHIMTVFLHDLSASVLRIQIQLINLNFSRYLQFTLIEQFQTSYIQYFKIKFKMLNVFKSTQAKELHQMLQNHNFFKEGIDSCHIEEIANHIKIHQSFAEFVSVVQYHQLQHFVLTKAILVLLSLIQVQHRIIQSSQLERFLCYLNERAVKLTKRPAIQENKLLRSLSPQNLIRKVDNVLNGINSSGKKKGKKEKPNHGSYLVQTILQPLLALISRIVACYDQVYRPQQEMDEHSCWATLNFLNKIGEFHKNFQEVGRYYNEEFGEVIYETVKVLDYDIRILYRKMVHYLKNNIKSVQTSIMEGKHKTLTDDQESTIKEILMFVGQIDKLNDNLRVIYLGKYYAKKFTSRGLRNVILFRGEAIVDSLDSILRNQTKLTQHRNKKAHLHLEKIETETTIGTQKSVRDELRGNELSSLMTLKNGSLRLL